MDRPDYGYDADENRRHPDGEDSAELPDYGYGQREPAGRESAGRERPSYGLSSEQAGTGDGTPVCPRHPDRVSYVRCQRCQRPACGDCQRSAAVGMICVDCARDMERQQAASSPRNAMGGAIARTATPIVSYAVIALCVVAFLGQTLAPRLVEQPLIFAPVRALAMPWTMLTSGFLHGGILHLGLNMYAMWIVGPYLERSIGHARFAAIFLLSVFAGHVAVLMLSSPADPSWISGTVGASGGVFGLFGAMFIMHRKLGAQTGQIIMLIVLNVVFSFTIPGISWQGHMGGLVVGTALTAIMFAVRPKATPGADRAALGRRAAALHTTAAVVMFLVLVGLVLAKVLTVMPGSFPSL